MSSTNDITITIGVKDYSFQQIQKLTTHAPVDTIDLSLLKGNLSSGNDVVDVSEVRLCKINKKWVVLTGFTLVDVAIKNSNLDLGPGKISALIMSKSFLDNAELPAPPANPATLVEKFASAGFRVRKGKEHIS